MERNLSLTQEQTKKEVSPAEMEDEAKRNKFKNVESPFDTTDKNLDKAVVREEEKIREEINYTNYDIEESNADCHVGICLEDFEENNDARGRASNRKEKIGDSTHIFNLSATDMNITTPKPLESNKKNNKNYAKHNEDFIIKEEECQIITMIYYSGP